MKNIVFAGNPGSGKSTLLNTLIGDRVFKSGVAFVGGLSSVFDYRIINGVQYSDTPGLDDYHKRRQAASEIEKAVNNKEYLCLVFVITLESGRLRNADVTTIKLILDAIANTGVSTHEKYSIIINKLTGSVYEKIQREFNKDSMFKLFSNDFGAPKEVLFVRKESNAEDEDNVLLSCQGSLQEFVKNAPIMRTDRSASMDAGVWSDLMISICDFIEQVNEAFKSFCEMV